MRTLTWNETQRAALAAGVMAAALCASATLAQSGERALRMQSRPAGVDIDAALLAPAPHEALGGERGPAWQDADENFESLPVASVLGQNGWFPLFAGAFFADTNALPARFGARSLHLPSGGLNIPWGARLSQSFVRSRRFDADIMVTGNFNDPTDTLTFQAVNWQDGFLNARVQLRRSAQGFSIFGDVFVQQVIGSGPDGEFIDTGVDWKANNVARYTIEVLDDNRVFVSINDALVFSGHDMAVALGGPGGTSRMAFILQGGLADVYIDNVSFVETSVADVTGDGRVNNDDLTALLNRWGTSHARTDLDASGVVSGPDLALLLAGWTTP